MESKKIRKLVFAALFAAICCVATMLLQLPSPVGGYVNMGDMMVLLSAWTFSPTYAFFASAIGSGMADVLSGYMYHAPGTFFIKGISALIACCFYRKGKKILGGIAAEIFMVAGYFLYACFALGRGVSAVSGIPGNIFQGIFGIIAAYLLDGVLKKNNVFKF